MRMRGSYGPHPALCATPSATGPADRRGWALRQVSIAARNLAARFT
jgi:hypothetical protein